MNKIIRVALIVVVALLVLIGIGSMVVRRLVEKELSALDLGEMRFSSGGVRVNLLRRTLSLREVRLVTDPERRDADTLHRSPLHYIDATIDRITLRGLRLQGIRQGSFDFHTLSVELPKGRVVTRPVPVPVSADTTKKASAFRLQKVAVQHVELSGGALDWQRITETDTLVYSAAGLDVALAGFRWEPTPESRDRVLFSDSLSGRIGVVRYTFAGGSYTLALDTVAWHAGRGELSVRRTELQPRYSQHDFPRKSVQKSDWMALNLDALSCRGVDFGALWDGRGVKIDSVHILSGGFSTYKDRRAPVPTRVKPMVHTTIQRIGLPLDIGKIRLDSLRAEYLELPEHGNRPGSIVFDRIGATIFGLTNRVEREDQYVELYATARLMGRGGLTAVISLPVDPANDRFEVKATLLAMPFSALNPMIEPLARVGLTAGRIDRMDFTMTGNSISARIDMILRYNDLHLAVLRDSRGRRQERPGLSRLLDALAVRHDNPDRHGLRTASTTVRRDSTRSAFNYLWKGVSAGAMETAESGAAKRLLGVSK